MTGKWIAAALTLAAAPAAPLAVSPAAAQQMPAYSDWVFFQSDKALQVRSVLLSVDGEVASMRYEFRLNRDDDIFCRDPDCQGYVLAAYNYDPVTRDATDRFSVYFPNAFTGVWTYPATVKTRFTTYPNGDRSFWDARLGAAFVPVAGGPAQKLRLVEGCADNRLASTSHTRCTDYGQGKVIDLSGVRGAMERIDIPASDFAPGATPPPSPATEPAPEPAAAPAPGTAPTADAPALDIDLPAPPIDPQAGASLDLNARAAAEARAQSERIAAEQAAAAAARAQYARDQAAYAAAQATYAADQAEYQRQLKAAEAARAAYERQYGRRR